MGSQARQQEPKLRMHNGGCQPSQGLADQMKLTLSQQAKPSDDVLFQEVGGEAVLLNLASESYFGLDPVGTRIWVLLSQDARLQAAFDVMREEYDVDPALLESDLLALVGKLVEVGLVRVG